LDPLGFAFEHYDGIGAFRELDNGLPVDATGSFMLDGQAVTFDGAVELSQLLAASSTVQDCFATHFSRYALDRHENPLDRASIEGAAQAFERSGGNVQELLVAVATSRSFRYRSLAPGEM
jgi:hypothetical protein